MKKTKSIMAAISGVIIGASLLSTSVTRGQGLRGPLLCSGACMNPYRPPYPLPTVPHLGQQYFRGYAPAPEPLEEDSKPKLSVRRDNDGKTTEITNFTEKETELENGLILGPNASLDLSDAGRIISGYVIKDGIKYTDEGGLENLTEQEVQLDMGKEHVILGPKTALDGEGNLHRGYIIVGDHK